MSPAMITYETNLYCSILLQHSRKKKCKSWYIPWEIPFCPHAHCRQHQAFWKLCEILYAALQQQCTVSYIELYLSIIENPHMYQHTWLVGHSSKTAWKRIKNKSGQQLRIHCLDPLAYAGVQNSDRTKSGKRSIYSSWRKCNYLTKSQANPFITLLLREGEDLLRPSSWARFGDLLTGQDSQQEQIFCVGYQTCKTQGN